MFSDKFFLKQTFLSRFFSNQVFLYKLIFVFIYRCLRWRGVIILASHPAIIGSSPVIGDNDNFWWLDFIAPKVFTGFLEKRMVLCFKIVIFLTVQVVYRGSAFDSQQRGPEFDSVAVLDSFVIFLKNWKFLMVQASHRICVLKVLMISI